MKHGKLLAIPTLALLLSVMVPGAIAVEAVDGVSALVTATGADQDVRVKFPIASDDPGTFTYNATIDATGPVEYADVETTFGGVRANGFITFTVTFSGPTASYGIFIHAWDGATEGTASCTVTVNTANLYEYDNCGTMAPAYTLEYCLNDDEDSSPGGFGFAVSHRVNSKTIIGATHIRFNAASGEAAYGGLNLGGDTSEYKFDFEIEAGEEGGTTKALMFFSEVTTDASTTSAASAKDVVAGSFTVPQDGAFTDGYGIVFEEDGFDWVARMFRNSGGSTTYLLEETWSDGIVNANSMTAGTLRISEFEGIFELTLGNEVGRFALEDIGEPNDFHTFWISEYGAGAFGVARHFQNVDGTSGCLSSIDPTFGGASAATGAPSSGQPLEDFDGQGGRYSDPVFPMIDVNSLSNTLGISLNFTAWILFGVVLLLAMSAGYMVARGIGAGVGAFIGLPVASIMGLNPLWVVVFVFIFAVGKLFLTSRGGG